MELAGGDRRRSARYLTESLRRLDDGLRLPPDDGVRVGAIFDELAQSARAWSAPDLRPTPPAPAQPAPAIELRELQLAWRRGTSPADDR
jgi:hypothetical protein